MQFITRQSLTRWGGILLFVALLMSAACTGSTDPLAAENTTPDYSHAAGEGYIGPAATAHGVAGSAAASPVPTDASPEPDTGTHA
jgi:hypothetical protein